MLTMSLRILRSNTRMLHMCMKAIMIHELPINYVLKALLNKNSV